MRSRGLSVLGSILGAIQARLLDFISPRFRAHREARRYLKWLGKAGLRAETGDWRFRNGVRFSCSCELHERAMPWAERLNAWVPYIEDWDLVHLVSYWCVYFKVDPSAVSFVFALEDGGSHTIPFDDFRRDLRLRGN